MRGPERDPYREFSNLFNAFAASATNDPIVVSYLFLGSLEDQIARYWGIEISSDFATITAAEGAVMPPRIRMIKEHFFDSGRFQAVARAAYLRCAQGLIEDFKKAAKWGCYDDRPSVDERIEPIKIRGIRNAFVLAGHSSGDPLVERRMARLFSEVAKIVAHRRRRKRMAQIKSATGMDVLEARVVQIGTWLAGQIPQWMRAMTGEAKRAKLG